MLAVNFTLLFRLIGHSLFKSGGKNYRLTARRIRFLLVVVLISLFAFTAAWAGFLLDRLFFRGYKKQRIKKPVFIIGNFRTGSTFLFRVMAKDTKNFTCYKTWEIYFAPSVTQRKFLRGLLLLDKLLGNPFTNILDTVEKNVLSGIRLHKMGLREPEEDEGILLYIWSSFFTWIFFPVPGLADALHFFDHRVSPYRRRLIMKFYKECVQRHFYAKNSGNAFLSKNPSFTPKIKSILETFPDARFIYLYRDPVDTYTSTMSWFNVWFSSVLSPLEQYPFKNEVVELMKHWYSYPYEVFRELPKNSVAIVNYDNLVKDPKKEIHEIYRKFSLPVSQQFKHILDTEVEAAKAFVSPRNTTPEKIGMSHHLLKKAFHEIYREQEKRRR